MELQSPDGSTIPIERASGTVIGRGLGFGLRPSFTDRTISRRHLSLRLPFLAGSAGENDDPGAGSRVSFEVIGKNPILICRSSGGSKMVYRRSERGELETGDLISLSLKNPYFFALKRMEGEGAAVDQRVLDAVERREKRTLQRRKEKEEEKEKEKEKEEGTEDVSIGEVGNDEAVGELEIELGSLDVSQIDPVEVFGFLVKGREFDQYPRQKIRAVKDWNWFLEEPRRSSDDEVMDEATTSKGKGRRRSKKKGDDNEDEEWTEESEGEKELAMGAGSSKRPRYTTRLKDSKKLHKDTSGGTKPAVQKGAKSLKVEFEEEDEEDETLGGFVVDDEEEEAEGDEEDEEQEEEELEDEEESDDD